MIDRSIASLALKLVKAHQQTGSDHESESDYRSLCEGLPILLRTSGLARTVSYLSAKSTAGNAHGRLLVDLQAQLRELMKKDDLNLTTYAVSDLSTQDYRHLSQLVFRVAYWHKRLAQALLRTREG